LPGSFYPWKLAPSEILLLTLMARAMLSYHIAGILSLWPPLLQPTLN
jgi:hypothetical protein